MESAEAQMSMVKDWSPRSFVDELSEQMKILEAMFSDVGLERLARKHPEHPAVRRYQTIKEILLTGGRISPQNELSAVREVAGFLMDRSTWADDAQGGEYWSFLPNDTLRNFICSRLERPELFDDVITELFFWAWLKRHSEAVPVTLCELEGMPDLRIGDDHPTWAEVKRIHRGSSIARVAKVIQKANSQIKSKNPTDAGCLLLYIERDDVRASFDDRIPSDVRPYVDAVAQAIAGNVNRSVAQVVVCWDDYFVLAEPGRPALYAPRRRSLLLKHAHARQSLTLTDAFWDLGMTVTLWITYSGMPGLNVGRFITDDLEITQQFRSENEFTDGIRPGHAVETIKSPDATQSFDFGGVEVSLFTRKITLGRRPYVLLIEVVRRQGEQPRLTSGFKLFMSEPNIDAVMAKPLEAFKILLNRFGRLIQVGSQTGVFVPYEVVSTAKAHRTELVKVLSDGPSKVSCLFRTTPLGAEVRWAYAIDLNSYRASLQSQGDAGR